MSDNKNKNQGQGQQAQQGVEREQKQGGGKASTNIEEESTEEGEITQRNPRQGQDPDRNR